jgi:hypothetical protein
MFTFNQFIPLSGISKAGTEQHITQTLSNANAFTPYIPPGAKVIAVMSTAQNSRYTLTGDAPTTSKGFQMKAGDPPILISLNGNIKLQFIAETSGAILEYEFGR